jgi:molecular chaperone GrpE (heat shock protein)
MAVVIPQIPDKAKNAKAAAAASNSVVQLRAAVEELADAVMQLQAQVDNLIRRGK